MDRIKNKRDARKWLLISARLLGVRTEYDAAREILKHSNKYRTRELAWCEEILKEVDC